MRPNNSLRWSVFGKWQEWFRTKFLRLPSAFPHLSPHSPESIHWKGLKKSLVPSAVCIRGHDFDVDMDLDVMSTSQTMTMLIYSKLPVI